MASELLQNMDDAMGPKDKSKFIGTKGLGFLSVIEIPTSPAIFSGDFHFQFNKENNKTAGRQWRANDFVSQAQDFRCSANYTRCACEKSAKCRLQHCH